MPLGTDHQTGSGVVAGTQGGLSTSGFIPELWSDEVIASYKNSLVLSDLVKKISFKGKKGDTLRIPKPLRGTVSAKTAETQVTLNAYTVDELIIYINKHYEYSRLMEDITEIQALASQRAFYTDDAGYALAKQVDSDLAALAAGFQSGTAYSAAVVGADGTTVWDATGTGNGSNITDIGIRNAIQVLDDADVPLDNRYLVIPPSEKNSLLGIDRFTSSDFIGPESRVRTGQFGEIYGVSVHVSTNLDTVVAADAITNYKACILMHRDALVHAEQMGVRSQSQYKQEWLGDLYTSDTIYGISEYRDESGVAIIVPA
jgi:hypothetical protein